MENGGNNPHHRRHHPGRHSLSSAVVSGDSHSDDDDTGGDIREDIFIQETDDDNYNDELEDEDSPLYAKKPFNNNSDDDDGLYDKDLDEENEAYVYKYLRGGTKEKIQIVVKSNKNQSQQQQQQQQETNNHEDCGSATATTPTTRHVHAYKPRNTDAVLSCPCCFNLLCMDCQRHAKYSNQYRAMFVMGIIVDWHTRLVYDEQRQHLQKKVIMNPTSPKNQRIVPTFAEDAKDDCDEEGPNKNGIPYYEEGDYFLVQCADCRTEVAALDMKDEVYHFHGCLES